MTEKKEKKQTKSKKTTLKQKQNQKQSVVVNVNTEPAKKTRKRRSGTSEPRSSKGPKKTSKGLPQGNNISFNPVISFPSQEQLYRQVHSEIQNQPPPVLGNANDINASIAGIINSIKQQNIPNKQEALASAIPKMEVLKEQAQQSIKVENQFNKDIDEIKENRMRQRHDDDVSLLGDDTRVPNQAAVSIQGAYKGHLARKKVISRANDVVDEMINNQAATKLQSTLRGHKGRKQFDKAVENDFMNSEMAEAIKNAQKNGHGNVVFSQKTPRGKKPVVMTTQPPPVKFPQAHLTSQLVFAPERLDFTNSPPAKRGRGRPKGSVNKGKEQHELERGIRKLTKSMVSKSGKIKI
jgi:hypothetical protein